MLASVVSACPTLRPSTRLLLLPAWEKEHVSEGESFDPEAFRRDILPLLQYIPFSEVMDATWLGLRYCSDIRRGLKVSHPMHWDSLASLPGR